MEDSSLSQEAHTDSVKSIYRQSGRRVCGPTYQPDIKEDGKLFSQVRSALDDALLYYDEPTSLLVRPIERCTGVLYQLFFAG